MELGSVVAVLLALGRPGALDEHGLEPGSAFAQGRGPALAGALVLAGAQTGPSDEVSGAERAAHVAADFRQDGGGGQGAHAGDRAQQGDQSTKAGLTGGRLLIQLGDCGADLAVDLLDRRAQSVVLPKMELQQKAVMV